MERVRRRRNASNEGEWMMSDKEKFEVLWARHCAAVERLGWERPTDSEKAAAYWGWMAALNMERGEKTNAS